MEQIFIIQQIVKKLSMLNTQMVYVYLKHILYGSQKIKCALHALWDGERVGLIINNEEIYITVNELRDIYIDNNEYYIKSDVMEIRIVPINI